MRPQSAAKRSFRSSFCPLVVRLKHTQSFGPQRCWIQTVETHRTNTECAADYSSRNVCAQRSNDNCWSKANSNTHTLFNAIEWAQNQTHSNDDDEDDDDDNNKRRRLDRATSSSIITVRIAKGVCVCSVVLEQAFGAVVQQHGLVRGLTTPPRTAGVLERCVCDQCVRCTSTQVKYSSRTVAANEAYALFRIEIQYDTWDTQMCMLMDVNLLWKHIFGVGWFEPNNMVPIQLKRNWFWSNKYFKKIDRSDFLILSTKIWFVELIMQNDWNDHSAMNIGPCNYQYSENDFLCLTNF